MSSIFNVRKLRHFNNHIFILREATTNNFEISYIVLHPTVMKPSRVIKCTMTIMAICIVILAKCVYILLLRAYAVMKFRPPWHIDAEVKRYMYNVKVIIVNEFSVSSLYCEAMWNSPLCARYCPKQYESNLISIPSLHIPASLCHNGRKASFKLGVGLCRLTSF